MRAPILAVAAWSLLAIAGGVGSGCTAEPISVAVRSLERSGRVAFVCLGPPGAPPRDPADCAGLTTPDPDTFHQEGSTYQGHLYALITQSTRGEIAVVDVTAEEGSVLDQDPSVPGANFLPIGAQPVDVVATPMGTASFVTVGQVGRAGIFAIPSNMLRPFDRGNRPAQLSSWPACSLPSTPGSLMVVSDASGSCGDGEPAGENVPDLGKENRGRLKLLVALPDESRLVVVDAQALLNREPGSFGACPIERSIRLEVDAAAPPPPAPPPAGEACVNPDVPAPPVLSGVRARPAGLTQAAGRLYVADLDAPVIHVLDIGSPCSPAVLPPLTPTSYDDPSRLVRTSRVAVSPGLTPDLKRYLYAIDVDDGSVMVFDVSDGSSQRTPMVREHPEHNPFTPRDRIKFTGAARDVVLLERDEPWEDPTTGIAQTGVRCDPDPACSGCDARYRTASDYGSGAGPFVLRGTFAFVVLSSGQLAVIDVDDLDRACRGPKVDSALFGCAAEGDPEAPQATSGEVSCNVVVPHLPRDSVYVVSNDEAGRHAPGLQTYPLLYDPNGTVVPPDQADAPTLRAPAADPSIVAPVTVAVASEVLVVDPETGLVQSDDGPRQTVAMNLEDPRAQVADQTWSITYEGGLPGFAEKLGTLRLTPTVRGLYDASSRFCDLGVQSQRAAELVVTPGEAASFGDRLQITQATPAERDAYWSAPNGTCSYQSCNAKFGTAEAPFPTRELRIVEAYQDHLELDVSAGDVTDGDFKCCFPSAVSFAVRPSRQWVVVGSGSGFLHHTIPDPATGACRPSCDPAKARLNGRARTVTGDATLVGDAAAPNPLTSGVFYNPFFRFVVTSTTGEAVRGHQFRFNTVGAFAPMVVSLEGDTSVQPQALTLAPTGALAITDGSLEGLILVNPGNAAILGRYF